MRVKVKLYSILRHYAGADTIEIDVEDNERVSDIIKKLSNTNNGFARALEALSGEILVLDVNGRRLEPEDKPTSTIHIMPPPEGGANIDAAVFERGTRVSLDELLTRIPAEANIGAILLFIGTVRKINREKRVRELIYEHAGDLTESKLKEVTSEVAVKYNLDYAAAYHFVGRLKPGDTTMIIIVAGENRKVTMPALEELVERVKREVPIWKLEVYSDGSKSYIVGGRFIDDASTRA